MQTEWQYVNYDALPDLDPSKSFPRQAFVDLLRRDAKEGDAVLDIGAGPDENPYLAEAFNRNLTVDGVDVDPGVLDNESLRHRWHVPFESADIPDDSYDFALAFNVVEHIESAQPFFEKVARVLRPGGVFWAYTPNAMHPFAMLSRTLENLGTKSWFASRDEAVNDYPAYYRMNRIKSVERAIEHLPFESAKFYYLYAPGWKNYFPKPLRCFPTAWDVLTRHRSTSVVAYRLQMKETS